jgi:hypothetical protein
VRGKSIKEIVRELHVSRNTVRKVLRTEATAFSYEREVQPLPRIGPWREALDGLLAGNEGKPARERLEQDAREVATKRAKTFTTFFFPVGDDIKAIVAEWVRYVRIEKLWGGENDPLFPATETAADPARGFHAVGLARHHWSSAGPVRKIVRSAFKAVGVPYANPHSFRNTLVQLAYTLKLPPEAFKAWS